MFARSFDPLEGGILLSPGPALLYRTLRTTAKTICDFGRGRVSALPPDPSFPFARATDLVASVAAHSFGKRGGRRDGDFRGNISVTASIPRLLPPPSAPLFVLRDKSFLVSRLLPLRAQGANVCKVSRKTLPPNRRARAL